MLIRFLEYGVDVDDEFADAKYLQGYHEKDFGQLTTTLLQMVGQDIEVKGEYYTIDKIHFHVPNSEEEIACINVYCYPAY